LNRDRYYFRFHHFSSRVDGIISPKTRFIPSYITIPEIPTDHPLPHERVRERKNPASAGPAFPLSGGKNVNELDAAASGRLRPVSFHPFFIILEEFMTKTRRSLMVLLFMTMVLGVGLFLPGGFSNCRASASTMTIKTMIRPAQNLAWQEIRHSPNMPIPITYVNSLRTSKKVQFMVQARGTLREVENANLTPQRISASITMSDGSKKVMSFVSMTTSNFPGDVYVKTIMYEFEEQIAQQQRILELYTEFKVRLLINGILKEEQERAKAYATESPK
jgi:hypothetical protein